MQLTTLHIVCLDVPYPPDYGGVFDLFYKIKSLHALGIRIQLHCFEYGRGKQPELEAYCEAVYYYPRHKSLLLQFLRVPFIVSSRKNSLLLQRLNNIDAPVLLEGIHCTAYLATPEISSSNVWVRLHNIEYEYYKRLSLSTHSILKKIYFKYESVRLKRYERFLAKKSRYLTVSPADKDLYQQEFHPKQIHYLPVFLPFEKTNNLTGMGDYCLYHGNLSVPENEKAVEWLLQYVFNQPLMPLIIAGKNPGMAIKKLIAKKPNARLIANPSEAKMKDLIQHAHIHVLPVFNVTGIKIKLLNALYNGRFIITNDETIQGSPLYSLCIWATDAVQFRKAIIAYSTMSFSISDAEKRKQVLYSEFDNKKNARELIRYFEAVG